MYLSNTEHGPMRPCSETRSVEERRGRDAGRLSASRIFSRGADNMSLDCPKHICAGPEAGYEVRLWVAVNRDRLLSR